LLNAIKEFVDNEENEDKSLGAFLQEVALLTSVDEDKDDDERKVTLMTIHMAKGWSLRMFTWSGWRKICSHHR
jgi:DNA helicase-2/ATP-dependent DNA helicase PcrA